MHHQVDTHAHKLGGEVLHVRPGLNPDLLAPPPPPLFTWLQSVLFFDPSCDMKGWLAWGAGTLVVSFRGTASGKNACLDLDGLLVPTCLLTLHHRPIRLRL